ncbi:hypothetical protein [Candidatus Accumulibacter aalborgensis]|nr:hypothetical protein [Candidatus Accumulibacter aalborgensis]
MPAIVAKNRPTLAPSSPRGRLADREDDNPEELAVIERPSR